MTAKELTELSDWHIANARWRIAMQTVNEAYLAARQLATVELRQALGEGRLPADYIGLDGEQHSVPAAVWRTDAGAAAMQDGSLNVPAAASRAAVMGSAVISEALFAQWLKPPEDVVTHTIGIENRLAEWLATQMLANPNQPRPKDRLKTEAAARDMVVSDRGFERAWGVALAKTGVNWSVAGRRPGKS